MSQIKLGNLVAKLDSNLKAALEEAAGAAMAQTVVAIEIEHWFVQLLTANETNLVNFLSKQNVDSKALLAELTARINRLRTGSTGQPTISRALSELMEDAWMQRR
ncbi:ClpB protein [Vibrio ponticus]|nr:ClpB protein [Vibrio ponticus]